MNRPVREPGDCVPTLACGMVAKSAVSCNGKKEIASKFALTLRKEFLEPTQLFFVEGFEVANLLQDGVRFLQKKSSGHCNTLTLSKWIRCVKRYIDLICSV